MAIALCSGLLSFTDLREPRREEGDDPDHGWQQFFGDQQFFVSEDERHVSKEMKDVTEKKANTRFWDSRHVRETPLTNFAW